MRANQTAWIVEIPDVDAAPAPGEGPAHVTLLDLVRAVGEVTEDDREVVATVRAMLRSGRVKLCGNFRSAPPDEFA